MKLYEILSDILRDQAIIWSIKILRVKDSIGLKYSYKNLAN